VLTGRIPEALSDTSMQPFAPSCALRAIRVKSGTNFAPRSATGGSLL
jgi:hypothetical protein